MRGFLSKIDGNGNLINMALAFVGIGIAFWQSTLLAKTLESSGAYYENTKSNKYLYRHDMGLHCS